MAEKRKLQQEVERILKKIDEGMSIFDSTLEKFEIATQVSQKEKLGDDLKKEIKKLQRHRELVKQWQNNPDAKDKDSLNRYRKKIEDKMEIFKNVERDAKTKAYSREGLMQGNVLNQEEQERLKTREWINNVIHELNIKAEMQETEIDACKSGKRTIRMNGRTFEKVTNQNFF